MASLWKCLFVSVCIVAGLASGTGNASAQTVQGCGNEGETPCPVFSATEDVCDTGLRVSLPSICGCVFRGFFGNCIIPRLCYTCENSTRWNNGIASFTSSWINWALKNQRDLAEDEPLNRVMHLGTHNSFSSSADRHPLIVLPNQIFSMSDQLRAGARLLSLDLHFLDNNARLCHSPTELGLPETVCRLDEDDSNPLTGPSGMRFYSNGIEEIRNWLNLPANANEIVLINTEDRIIGANGEREDYLLDPLRRHFGSKMLSSPFVAPAGFTTPRWPTRREMLANGHRVIFFAKSGERPPAFSEHDVVGGFSNLWWARNLKQYPGCPTTSTFNASGSNDTITVPSDSVMETGDLVYLRPAAGASLPVGLQEGVPYFVRRDDGAFTIASDRAGLPIDFVGNGTGTIFFAPSKRAPLTVEDREWARVVTGVLDAGAVARAAECNYSFIILDKFASTDLGGVNHSRTEAAVWSWRENDRGNNGRCALMDGVTGRWASADCSLPRRFACAKPRSESGLDPLVWEDPLGLQWRLTSGAGPWSAGHEMCQAEFPGYVASVPVNGYQNRILKGAIASGDDVWLNYHRPGAADRWTIRRVPNANAPPIADAGLDQVVECGATVTLNGSGSTDPNGDTLAYTWTGPFGARSGPVVQTTLEPGNHSLTLTVNDGRGGFDTDSVDVSVRDGAPPSLALELSPNVLWPANGKLVDIVARIKTKDGCDTEEPAIELVSIVSNAKNPKTGQPVPTAQDIVDAEPGTDDRDFKLRASPNPKNEEQRTYTVTYRARDFAGNATEMSAEVVVDTPRKPRHRKDAPVPPRKK